MDLKITSINVVEFQAYIKKLLAIDKFIFLKMDANTIVSSVYFPQRDAVKSVSVNTKDIFTFDKPLKDTVKIAFFDGSKIIEALNFLKNSDEIQGKIVYSEFNGVHEADDFVLFNKVDRLKLVCAARSLSFMDMTDDEKSRAFGTSGLLFDFNLLSTHLDKMKDLFKLDKDVDTFEFVIDPTSNVLNLKGSSYESLISSNVNVQTVDTIKFYKKYIPLIDKSENYKAYVCHNKMVLKSEDSNSMLTVAACMGGS